mgnify:CR=1 FL=1
MYGLFDFTFNGFKQTGHRFVFISEFTLLVQHLALLIAYGNVRTITACVSNLKHLFSDFLKKLVIYLIHNKDRLT